MLQGNTFLPTTDPHHQHHIARSCLRDQVRISPDLSDFSHNFVGRVELIGWINQSGQRINVFTSFGPTGFGWRCVLLLSETLDVDLEIVAQLVVGWLVLKLGESRKMKSSLRKW